MNSLYTIIYVLKKIVTKTKKRAPIFTNAKQQRINLSEKYQIKYKV